MSNQAESPVMSLTWAETQVLDRLDRIARSCFYWNGKDQEEREASKEYFAWMFRNYVHASFHANMGGGGFLYWYPYLKELKEKLLRMKKVYMQASMSQVQWMPIANDGVDGPFKAFKWDVNNPASGYSTVGIFEGVADHETYWLLVSATIDVQNGSIDTYALMEFAYRNAGRYPSSISKKQIQSMFKNPFGRSNLLKMEANGLLSFWTRGGVPAFTTKFNTSEVVPVVTYGGAFDKIAEKLISYAPCTAADFGGMLVEKGTDVFTLAGKLKKYNGDSRSTVADTGDSWTVKFNKYLEAVKVCIAAKTDISDSTLTPMNLLRLYILSEERGVPMEKLRERAAEFGKDHQLDGLTEVLMDNTGRQAVLETLSRDDLIGVVCWLIGKDMASASFAAGAMVAMGESQGSYVDWLTSGVTLTDEQRLAISTQENLYFTGAVNAGDCYWLLKNGCSFTPVEGSDPDWITYLKGVEVAKGFRVIDTKATKEYIEKLAGITRGIQLRALRRLCFFGFSAETPEELNEELARYDRRYPPIPDDVIDAEEEQ